MVTRAVGEQEGNWDVCELEGFSERSHLGRLSEIAFTRMPCENRSAYIRCKSDEDLRILSSKYLREIGRFTRRATEAYGQVALELEPAGTLDEVFDEFVRIEDAGWKGSRGMRTSIVCTGEQGIAFYRQLHKEFGATGDCKIVFLRFGDIRVAAGFALHTAGCWHLYKIGYDEQYAKYSPGNVMLKLLINEMARDQAAVEINLVTCPGWVKPWHMDSEALSSVVIYGNSIMARTIRFLRAVRNGSARSANTPALESAR